MRILFLGDIVGPAGVNFIKRALPLVRDHLGVDSIIANAENASGGSGITPGAFRELRNSGIDLMTLGDHIYRRAEIIPTLQKEQLHLQARELPRQRPGHDFALATTSAGAAVAVISLLGRTFMRPVDCPFAAVDRVLQAILERTRCIIVDIHAEATGDKYLMAHHLKGRVSAVLGTHTHVPTADEQIFPGGTAFISDVGMTGPYDSILGRRVDRVLLTAVTFVPSAFDVATGDPRLSGAVVEIDPATGQATAIRRYQLDEAGLALLQAHNQPAPKT